MKIQGGAPTPAAGPARASGPQPQGFSVPSQGVRASGPAGPSAPVRAITSLDALIALQETPGPGERRRRAVKRAGKMLDALDALKIALLDGAASTASLSALMEAVEEERSSAEEPGLQAVLDEIETRAAVELAKRERGGAAELA